MSEGNEIKNIERNIRSGEREMLRDEISAMRFEVLEKKLNRILNLLEKVGV